MAKKKTENAAPVADLNEGHTEAIAPASDNETKNRPAAFPFSYWVKLKGDKDVAVGVKIRFKIEDSEEMTEKEFDGFIHRFLKN